MLEGSEDKLKTTEQFVLERDFEDPKILSREPEKTFPKTL